MGNLTLVPALVVVVLALGGAVIAAVGAFGLLRLRSFYDRAHPATLAATMGATGVLLACVAFFSFLEGRLMPKAFLAVIFIPLVNPVTTMLLARAALARDRSHAFGPRGLPDGVLPPDAAVAGVRSDVPGSEDAEWRRKARELASAQAEAAEHQAGSDTQPRGAADDGEAHDDGEGS